MTLYLPVTVDLYNPYPLKVMNIPQYNTGRGALITLTAAGQVIVPDSESLYIYAKKADGTMVYAACALEGTQIRASFGEQMTAVAGVLNVEIQMVDSSGSSITTTIFQINVMASNIDYQKITSQDEFAALVSALVEVNELKKKGLKGDPGEAATLQIGTVTASEPGSDPEVVNSGTDQNAVLDFVIPRGMPGPQGPAISTIDPKIAEEADAGKAADAYYTRQAIGDLSILTTTDKSSLVAAVNEQNVNIDNLNGKTAKCTLVQIKGTTDETGGIIVNVNTDFTNKFVISNISDTSITPYKITIINHSSDFIYFRFRKYSDNSAVTNTAVDTTVLVIGMN